MFGNRTSRLLASLAALSFTAMVHAGPILYKWQDDKGIVHYSEHPPVGVTNFERVRSEVTPGNSPVDYQTESPEQSKKDEASEPEQPQIDQARCDNARKNLEALNSFARIRITEPDGKVRFLSESEVAERKVEFKNILDQECVE
ncbi:DUF4124 domain-containing protein [Halioxenophilus sp. WMMB6]|uniref:DUF4124 domain-containing protein n=1 Tax=Halioxenophilus sp. WMMB6 TaxID=3073815 RepID=UPI00295E3255|nr:DUF4124 domain-containing protein [Halioxenophilus sp. WMMB6]